MGILDGLLGGSNFRFRGGQVFGSRDARFNLPVSFDMRRGLDIGLSGRVHGQRFSLDPMGMLDGAFDGGGDGYYERRNSRGRFDGYDVNGMPMFNGRHAMSDAYVRSRGGDMGGWRDYRSNGNGRFDGYDDNGMPMFNGRHAMSDAYVQSRGGDMGGWRDYRGYERGGIGGIFDRIGDFFRNLFNGGDDRGYADDRYPQQPYQQQDYGYAPVRGVTQPEKVVQLQHFAPEQVAQAKAKLGEMHLTQDQVMEMQAQLAWNGLTPNVTGSRIDGQLGDHTAVAFLSYAQSIGKNVGNGMSQEDIADVRGALAQTKPVVANMQDVTHDDIAPQRTPATGKPLVLVPGRHS